VFFYREGAPRNTAKWSPCGRMLCIAGFGNLNGLIDIWFVKKLMKVGVCKAPFSSYFGWSPESAYLMTAVLSPKMTVDNGFKIFKFDGTLYNEQKRERLYEVAWKKAAPGVLPRIKIVPVKVGETAPIEKKELYRHPSLEGRQQQHDNQYSKAEEGPQKHTKPVNKQQQQQQQQNVKTREELEFLSPSKSSLKNKKRREKRRQKQDEGGEGSGGSGGMDSPNLGSDTSPKETNAERDLKALKKKLRQTQLLKQRQDNGDVLDDAQLSKLTKVEELTTKIKELEKAGVRG